MEKIISELRHRAWQERAAARIGRTSKQRTAEAEHAARALENYADTLEREATPVATTRTVEWGHNGITFLDGKDIIGQAWFPTGPQGPIDGTIGSKERKHWQDVCAAWKERGELFTAYVRSPVVVAGSITGPQTDWTVYKTEDDTFPVTRHATQGEAEARIVEIEKTDPDGVHNGDYSIDGPTD